MTIAKLFARIGFNADSSKVEKFTSSLSDVITGLNQAVELGIKFNDTIKSLVNGVFDAVSALQQFSAETGANVEELQRWQSVANKTNESAAAVAQSIKAIVLNQEKIKLGQGNISGFQLLGIDPTQDPFKILNELKTETAGLSQGMKKHVLSQIGVSSELIQVLELTNEEFEKMKGSAFVIPKSSIELLDEAEDSIVAVNAAVKWLKTQIAVKLAPGIILMNKAIIKWVKNNKDGVIKTIKLAFVWITKFSNSIINSVRMINRIIKGTIGWENAIKGLLVVLAVLNAGLIASPIGLIITGIILLIAVLDDLYIYSTGKGQSMFGLLMKKFPEFEEKMLGFLGVLTDVKDLMTALFKGDETGIEGMIQKLGDLGKDLVFVFEILKGIFNFSALIVNTMLDSMKSIFKVSNLLFKGLKGETTVESFFKEMGGIFEDLGKEQIQGIMKFGGQVSESAKTVQNTYNIKTDVITGSGDPKEIADKIDEKIQRSITSSSAQRIRNE